MNDPKTLKKRCRTLILDRQRRERLDKEIDSFNKRVEAVDTFEDKLKMGILMSALVIGMVYVAKDMWS